MLLSGCGHVPLNGMMGTRKKCMLGELVVFHVGASIFKEFKEFKEIKKVDSQERRCRNNVKLLKISLEGNNQTFTQSQTHVVTATEAQRGHTHSYFVFLKFSRGNEFISFDFFFYLCHYVEISNVILR